MPLRVRAVCDPRDVVDTRRAAALMQQAPPDLVIDVVSADATASLDPARLDVDLVLTPSSIRHEGRVATLAQWRMTGWTGRGAPDVHVRGRAGLWWVDQCVPLTYRVPELDAAAHASARAAGNAHASWFDRLRFLGHASDAWVAGPGPAATVVIPLRRQHDAWLEACVRSALAQDADVRVIVVTAAETPPSNRAVLARFESDRRLVVIEQPAGAGLAGAFNAGIRASSAPRIAFLLSDDWLDPGAVSRCLREACDIVSTGQAVHDAVGTHTFWTRAPQIERFLALPSTEARASYLSHLLVFRREALFAVAGVDPMAGSCGPDDFDLPWTLLEHGASAALVPDVLYHYRDHDGERLTLRAPEEQARDLAATFDKHGVTGTDRAARIARHLAWAGEPCHVVAARLGVRATPS